MTTRQTELSPPPGPAFAGVEAAPGAAGGFSGPIRFNLAPTDAACASKWLTRNDPPVLYHPVLADRLGNTVAALIVAQALYWVGKSKRRGHFWKSVAEWCEELKIGRAAIREGIRVAKLSGILLARQYKGKSVHYSVDTDRMKCVLTGKSNAPCINPSENRTGQYREPTHAEIEHPPCGNRTTPMRKSNTTHPEIEPVNTETSLETLHKLREKSRACVSVSPEIKRIEELKRLIEQATAINTMESLRHAARYAKEIAAMGAA